MTSTEVRAIYNTFYEACEATKNALPPSENEEPIEFLMQSKIVTKCDDGVYIKGEKTGDGFTRYCISVAAKSDTWNLHMFSDIELIDWHNNYCWMLTQEPIYDPYTDLVPWYTRLKEDYPDEIDKFDEFITAFQIQGISYDNVGIDPETNKLKIFDWFTTRALTYNMEDGTVEPN